MEKKIETTIANQTISEQISIGKDITTREITAKKLARKKISERYKNMPRFKDYDPDHKEKIILPHIASLMNKDVKNQYWIVALANEALVADPELAKTAGEKPLTEFVRVFAHKWADNKNIAENIIEELEKTTKERMAAEEKLLTTSSVEKIEEYALKYGGVISKDLITHLNELLEQPFEQPLLNYSKNIKEIEEKDNGRMEKLIYAVSDFLYSTKKRTAITFGVMGLLVLSGFYMGYREFLYTSPPENKSPKKLEEKKESTNETERYAKKVYEKVKVDIEFQESFMKATGSTRLEIIINNEDTYSDNNSPEQAGKYLIADVRKQEVEGAEQVAKRMEAGLKKFIADTKNTNAEGKTVVYSPVEGWKLINK